MQDVKNINIMQIGYFQHASVREQHESIKIKINQCGENVCN